MIAFQQRLKEKTKKNVPHPTPLNVIHTGERASLVAATYGTALFRMQSGSHESGALLVQVTGDDAAGSGVRTRQWRNKTRQH